MREKSITRREFVKQAGQIAATPLLALGAAAAPAAAARRRYALVTSSSQPLTPRRRPAADWGSFACCALVTGAIAGMYLAILVYSLVARWPYNFTPTLRHYRRESKDLGGTRPKKGDRL